MPVLFPSLPFNSLETPLSFATRLASFHLRSSVATFLHDISVSLSAMIGCEGEALARLADVAGVDHGDLNRNAARRVAKRRFDLRGHDLSSEFFSSPNTVFCPACLREDDRNADDVGSVRFGRLDWSLRPIRTCPLHGLLLLHRKRQHWDDMLNEMALRVPEREDELDRLIETSQQWSPSPLQHYVLSRLNGAADFSWLDSQGLEQAVRATEMLGALVEFGAKVKPSQLRLDQWDQAGAAGFAITSKGESAIRATLADVQTSATNRPGKLGAQKIFGVFYNWLSSNKRTKEPGDIKRILREHIFETMAVGSGETVLGRTLPERRFHSVASLAAESSLNSRTLRTVLAASGLVPVEEKVSGYHVFDAEAGRKVASSIQRMTAVTSLPKALGCTRPQADQLLDEQLIVQISDTAGATAGRTQKGVDNLEIERFLEALRAKAMPVEAAPGRMVPISKAAEKAKCPCVEIVHLILGGFLANVVRLRDVHGYAAVLVDPDEVRQQIQVVMQDLPASTAFGRLKIPKSTGWTLASRSEGPRLPVQVVEGKDGGHRIYRFTEEAVEAFMAEFTTPARIANQHGEPIGIIMNRLKRAGVRPVMTRREVGIDFFRVSETSVLEAP
jgi:hypothetical protein